MGHTFWKGWIAAALLAAASLAAGCRGRSEADYIPAAEPARAALVKALDAWRKDEPPGRIEGRPAIQVGDTHRRTGQRLARYEVLGELPSDEGRLFSVRVYLENPAAEEKVNYLVVGIDPLWVWRQEDYHMLSHWEHKMPPPAQPPAAPSVETVPSE